MNKRSQSVDAKFKPIQKAKKVLRTAVTLGEIGSRLQSLSFKSQSKKDESPMFLD